MLVGDVIRMCLEHRISGVPVVEGRRVLGMVTNRDLRFETDEPACRLRCVKS